MLQTIHKLYINPTLKRSKPYTKRSANPTQNGAKTLHCNGAQTLHGNGAQFYLGAHLSKFEEGKLKFEEGKAKFEEGKLKFEEGKF